MGAENDFTKTSASESVYQLIRRRIVQGVYHPGGALKEADLAKSIGCSRTPIRESLRRLESDGLVDILPNKGARVADWVGADPDQIFFLRANLEGFAARRAAVSISALEISGLVELAEAMEKVESSGSPLRFEEIAELNYQFHRGIFEATGDKRLASIMSCIIEVGSTTHTFKNYTKVEVDRSFRHHRELIDAFESRDGDWAESVIRCHIYAARVSAAKGQDRSLRSLAEAIVGETWALRSEGDH